MKKLQCGCGAPLRISANERFAICIYCESVYDLDNGGNISHEKNALFSLASDARDSGSYDEACRLYREILRYNSPENAYQAYWGITLCEYHARLTYIESENRMNVQCDGCLRDINDNRSFRKALRYGANDPMFIGSIRAIAKQIQFFVDSTVSVRGNRPNYDVFLCYKTKNAHGEYTPEYTVAYNLFLRLERKGYRVFFADAVTGLDSRNYTAIIYFALKKSKMLLYCCSSTENAKSIWMTNELETYLDFMAKDDDNDKRICPVLCGGADSRVLPKVFAEYDPWRIDMVGSERSYIELIDKITDLVHPSQKVPHVDPDTGSQRSKQNSASTAPGNFSDRARVTAGSSITLGQYAQSSTQPEPLEWLVLKADSDKALVISKFIIAGAQYGGSAPFWSVSDLRGWLNGAFLSNAFSPEQRLRIMDSVLDNRGNQKFGTPAEDNTSDKLFCLSISEATALFLTDQQRIAQPTSQAVLNGVRRDDYGGSWWLRSPGSSGFAANVHSGGFINTYGSAPTDGGIGVRPAFWIKL